MKRTTISALLGALTLAAASQAMAGAVLYNSAGDLVIGVNDEGHLNTQPNVTANSTATGLAFDYSGTGAFEDATAPGCLCEGWGVSGSGVSGYANVSVDGVVNLTVDSFTDSATNITSTTSLTSTPGFTVTQSYSQSDVTDRLFEVTVTIANTTGSTLTDVQYVRVMDWDIPPTEFDEYVTIQGTGTTTNLVTSHDNGFATANPLAATSFLDAATLDVDFADNGPADHGAYFLFGFGDLADGESLSFSIYYGAAATESAMLTALGAESVELFSLGESSGDPTTGTPATFAFAFSGVGGTTILPGPGTVPVPGTLLLMGAALIGLVRIRRSAA